MGALELTKHSCINLEFVQELSQRRHALRERGCSKRGMRQRELDKTWLNLEPSCISLTDIALNGNFGLMLQQQYFNHIALRVTRWNAGFAIRDKYTRFSRCDSRHAFSRHIFAVRFKCDDKLKKTNTHTQKTNIWREIPGKRSTIIFVCFRAHVQDLLISHWGWYGLWSFY